MLKGDGRTRESRLPRPARGKAGSDLRPQLTRIPRLEPPAVRCRTRVISGVTAGLALSLQQQPSGPVASTLGADPAR